MDEAAVEVIEAVVGFKRDGFFKFSQGVVDLVEHHHAVTPVRVVLCVFVIEPDGSAEIVHGLLVVPNAMKASPLSEWYLAWVEPLSVFAVDCKLVMA